MRFTIVALVALLTSACQRGMQTDASGMGHSPIAELAVNGTYGGGEEGNAKFIANWIATKCDLSTEATVKACVTELGMRCDAAIGDEMLCRYRGSVRSRPVEFVVTPSWPHWTGEWSETIAVNVIMRYWTSSRSIDVSYYFDSSREL